MAQPAGVHSGATACWLESGGPICQTPRSVTKKQATQRTRFVQAAGWRPCVCGEDGPAGQSGLTSTAPLRTRERAALGGPGFS